MTPGRGAAGSEPGTTRHHGPEDAIDRDGGRAVLRSFLSWAREAIARDPGHRADVEKALAETTMAPELRRVAEAEIEHLSDEHPPSPASRKAAAARAE